MKLKTQKLYIDPDVYRKAKVQAAVEDKTITKWIEEAIKEKLGDERKK